MSAQGRAATGCLLLLVVAFGLGMKACGDFIGRDFVAEAEQREAALKELARTKRRAWMKEARAAAQVSIDKVTRNYNTGFIAIDYTVTNAGDRTFCHVETGVTTRWYKDQVRGGVMPFNTCLAPGESAKDTWRVRGYSVTSYSVNDVTYKDDCRRRPNWDSLLSDRECALTHGFQFHGGAAY